MAGASLSTAQYAFLTVQWSCGRSCRGKSSKLCASSGLQQSSGKLTKRSQAKRDRRQDSPHKFPRPCMNRSTRPRLRGLHSRRPTALLAARSRSLHKRPSRWGERLLARSAQRNRLARQRARAAFQKMQAQLLGLDGSSLEVGPACPVPANVLPKHAPTVRAAARLEVPDCEVPRTAPIPKLPVHRCGAVPPALTPQFVAIAVLLSALHGLLIYWLLVRLGIGSQVP